MGLKIDDLETDSVFQDLVLGVFHATMHTFNGTPAAKIVENHQGRAFVKLHQISTIQIQPDQKPEDAVEVAPRKQKK